MIGRGTRSSRRAHLGRAATTLGGVLLAACGQAAQSTAPPADAKKPAQLRFAYRSGYLTVFDQFAAEFQKKAPHITVTTEPIPGDVYTDKLNTGFSSGAAADLTWIPGISGYFDFALRKQLLDVDPYVNRDKLDRNQWFAGALEMMRVGGKLYSLPLWAHPSAVGLYYNAEILQREGQAPPDGTWTFEKTLSVAQRFSRQSGGPETSTFGLVPTRGLPNGFSQLLRAFGSRAYSPDGKKAQFSTPQAIEAAQWVADLYQRHRVSPPSGLNPDPWRDGRVAMRIDLYGARNAARNASTPWLFRWGAHLGPKGAGGYGAELQTDANAIAAQTKFTDAAWEFHKYMSGREAGLALVKGSLLPGARPDVWTDSEMSKDATHTPFLAVMKTAPPLDRPANFRIAEVQRLVEPELNKIWDGKSTVRDGLAEVQRLAQQVVDQSPPGA